MKPTNFNQDLPEDTGKSLTPQLRAENTFGMFRTVSSVPTGIPRNWFDQIQIYSNAGTLRLYCYDSTNIIWRYTTLT